MRGYNRVILVGNLTRDPELRYTPKGTAVARLGLAVNRSWRDPETNETKEEVTFIDVDAWGKQAEVIAQYMKKGRPLLVEGRLKQDSWEDKNTKEKRHKMGVVLESFQFLGDGQGRSGESEGGDSGFNAAAPSAARPPYSAKPPAGSNSGGSGSQNLPPEEDDVPF